MLRKRRTSGSPAGSKIAGSSRVSERTRSGRGRPRSPLPPPRRSARRGAGGHPAAAPGRPRRPRNPGDRPAAGGLGDSRDGERTRASSARSAARAPTRSSRRSHRRGRATPRALCPLRVTAMRGCCRARGNHYQGRAERAPAPTAAGSRARCEASTPPAPHSGHPAGGHFGRTANGPRPLPRQHVGHGSDGREPLPLSPAAIPPVSRGARSCGLPGSSDPPPIAEPRMAETGRRSPSRRAAQLCDRAGTSIRPVAVLCGAATARGGGPGRRSRARREPPVSGRGRR